MNTPQRPAQPVPDPASIDDAVLALLWLPTARRCEELRDESDEYPLF